MQECSFTELKEWLKRAQLSEAQIRTKRGLVKKWKDLALEIPNESDALKQKISEAESVIEKQVIDLINIGIEISEVIEKVPDPIQRLILEKRYLLNKYMAEIAEEIHYSQRQIERLHDKALSKLKK